MSYCSLLIHSKAAQIIITATSHPHSLTICLFLNWPDPTDGGLTNPETSGRMWSVKISAPFLQNGKRHEEVFLVLPHFGFCVHVTRSPRLSGTRESRRLARAPDSAPAALLIQAPEDPSGAADDFCSALLGEDFRQVKKTKTGM